MSNAAAPRTLEITGVGAQGDGLAQGAFVPFTLPGERVEATVAGGRGELSAILQASPERVAPPCPHFGVCGGCALQHWAHPPYLAWKAEQIRLALARERIETEFAPGFAAPPESRRRLALHVRRGPGGVRLGYKERRSWSLVDAAVCPISDPRLVAAFPALRAVGGAFLQHPKSAPTLHVTLTDTGLDVDVTGVEKKSGGPSAAALQTAAQAAGRADLARLTLDGDMVYGERAPSVRFGRATVALPPGGFLQAVAAAEAFMAEVAVAAVTGAGKVADLFSGAGAFSFRLAEVAATHAVDGSEPAIRALTRAVGTAAGLKPVTAEARDLFRRPLGQPELKRFEAAVFDPPRAGAAAQAAELAASKLGVVVGVSCNPATFARDARLLIDGGFRLERVTPVDQFLWSPHIELVGVFRR
jgi:23S rRNA (uracil1939-C5)-methyltransferase